LILLFNIIVVMPGIERKPRRPRIKVKHETTYTKEWPKPIPTSGQTSKNTPA
jgi:hypothetical protein